jgi:hypothetical protein
MTRSSSSTSSQVPQDTKIWDSLKGAIAASSGFQRWQLERPVDEYGHASIEHLVRRYLRETLETLAY